MWNRSPDVATVGVTRIRHSPVWGSPLVPQSLIAMTTSLSPFSGSAPSGAWSISIRPFAFSSRPDTP